MNRSFWVNIVAEYSVTCSISHNTTMVSIDDAASTHLLRYTGCVCSKSLLISRVFIWTTLAGRQSVVNMLRLSLCCHLPPIADYTLKLCDRSSIGDINSTSAQVNSSMSLISYRYWNLFHKDFSIPEPKSQQFFRIKTRTNSQTSTRPIFFFVKQRDW